MAIRNVDANVSKAALTQLHDKKTLGNLIEPCRLQAKREGGRDEPDIAGDLLCVQHILSWRDNSAILSSTALPAARVPWFFYLDFFSADRPYHLDLSEKMYTDKSKKIPRPAPDIY